MFRAAILLVLFSICIQTRCQESDTLSYAEQLAIIEAEMDSLSIFNLIDNILSLDNMPANELSLRFSFSSSVTSAGRDYGLNQRGYAPGVSYYHKSGFYGDITGYWNSELDPNYNPTVASLGYLGSLEKNWSYSLDYERWFFNPRDTSSNPLTNALSTSLSFEYRFINLGIDYSFLFGTKSAHRLIGNLGTTINLGKWWIFDSISIFPGAMIMFGNTTVARQRITERTFNQQNADRLGSITTFENLNQRQRTILNYFFLIATENEIITIEERRSLGRKLRNSLPLTLQDQETLRKVADGVYQSSLIVEENAFGLLNYSFTVPLSLTIDRLSFLINYTYSIPISLPGELFEVDPIGYLGLSVAYRIPFK